MRHFGIIDASAAREAARTLLAKGADSILCVNELAYLGALAGIRDRLGDQAATIGMALGSGTSLPQYLGRAAFASFYPRRQAGVRLADLLLDRIGGAPVADCQELVQTRLTDIAAPRPQA